MPVVCGVSKFVVVQSREYKGGALGGIEHAVVDRLQLKRMTFLVEPAASVLGVVSRSRTGTRFRKGRPVSISSAATPGRLLISVSLSKVLPIASSAGVNRVSVNKNQSVLVFLRQLASGPFLPPRLEVGRFGIVCRGLELLLRRHAFGFLVVERAIALGCWLPPRPSGLPSRPAPRFVKERQTDACIGHLSIK